MSSLTQLVAVYFGGLTDAPVSSVVDFALPDCIFLLDLTISVLEVYMLLDVMAIQLDLVCVPFDNCVRSALRTRGSLPCTP